MLHGFLKKRLKNYLYLIEFESLLTKMNLLLLKVEIGPVLYILCLQLANFIQNSNLFLPIQVL